MDEDHDRGSGIRTVALLKLVAESGHTFTLSELAAKAALPASSVHRLLQPLLRGGLVERAEGQAYRAGSEFLRIASLVMREMDAGRIARPILHRLWAEWEETCSLCMYKPVGHFAVVLETIQTPHALRFVIEPFAELSLAWGSLGRAILGSLPPADAEAAMQRPVLGPLSGQPPATPEEMAEVIAGIRAQGFAEYRNEQIDAAGVAAPVYRGDGSVFGSIGITAPARRLRVEMVPQMSDAVKQAAQELSELFGYKGSSALVVGR
ncbi:MAG: IclR family transcriptional regulator [Candidatus Andeanibacterium colombiense]|uniref:IclR family transcriptional regulator n=1 Tax=Candidatus Andeanibacterium colombiense TaxID=3121345 RepID=A0AAJ6BMC0_9SPHN|nr:MAG: IclR family transcriptional regulator [Sphingomonadaceae bacterium]